MTIIVPIHLILTALILQAMRIASLPEEAFFGYPLQADEEYVYLDSRADANYPAMPSSIKQSETRRRSILDKNFARFGRSGGGITGTKLIPVNPNSENMKMMYLNNEDVGGVEMRAFGRNPRSGERNDQFIRFGRGKSDFLRFGRGGGSNFVRFGRSTRSVKNEKLKLTKPKIINKHITTKRENKMADGNVNKIEDEHKIQEAKIIGNRQKRAVSNLDYYKKSGSNFVRFGRDRNDNFMRFGRMLNDYPQNTDEFPNNSYNNTAILMKYLQSLHDQQGQKDNQLLIKILFNLLSKNQNQDDKDRNLNVKECS